MLIGDVNSLKKNHDEQVRIARSLSKISIQKNLDSMWEDDHMSVIYRDDVYWVIHSTLPVRGLKIGIETNLGTPFPKECLRQDQIERLDQLV